MPYAALQNTKLYYKIYGAETSSAEQSSTSKPTIIVVHGGPGYDHSYEVPFLSQCESFAQVVFYDQRGHGRSEGNDPSEWHLQQWAQDIHTLCETLGISKPFVFGDSFGGYVAMQYAIMFPGHAAGVILVDTEARFDFHALLDAFEQKGGITARKVAERCYQDPSAENFSDYVKHCLPLCSVNPIPDNLFKDMIERREVAKYYNHGDRLNYNLLSELHKIEDPVLFLTNSINPFHRLEEAQLAAHAMINCHLEVFPDCGLVAIDAPEQAIEKIHDFIRARVA